MMCCVQYGVLRGNLVVDTRKGSALFEVVMFCIVLPLVFFVLENRGIGISAHGFGSGRWARARDVA